MIDVDVWVRGRTDATTQRVMGIGGDATAWTDEDVKKLLEGMLLALQRTSDPAGENSSSGGLASPRFRQVASPLGLSWKQRWNTQMLPFGATWTLMTSPHLP